MRNPTLWAGVPGWLLRHSSLAKIIAAARFRVTGETLDSGPKPDLIAPAPDAVVNEAVAAYFANHASAQARCRELGYMYIAFLQPTVISSLRPKMTIAERAALDDFQRRMYRRPGVHEVGLERFYAKASIRARGKSWFYDISRLFEATKGEVYLDACHYSKEGNRLIAQKIADVLIKDGLLKHAHRS